MLLELYELLLFLDRLGVSWALLVALSRSGIACVVLTQGGFREQQAKAIMLSIAASTMSYFGISIMLSLVTSRIDTAVDMASNWPHEIWRQRLRLQLKHNKHAAAGEKLRHDRNSASDREDQRPTLRSTFRQQACCSRTLPTEAFEALLKMANGTGLCICLQGSSILSLHKHTAVVALLVKRKHFHYWWDRHMFCVGEDTPSVKLFPVHLRPYFSAELYRDHFIMGRPHQA